MSQSFEEWFEEYCEQNCPTEGYDDAFAAAGAAYHAGMNAPTKTNLSIDEVRAMLVYMENQNLTNATVEIKKTGIGAIVLISQKWDTEQKDVTNYGSW